jgi:hypothetical protein
MMDLSVGFGASSAGSDMNGATLFCVSGRVGLASLSMRMRGGADLVEAAIELAVDGREEREMLASLLEMTGDAPGVFEAKGASDRRGGEVRREDGRRLEGVWAGRAGTGEGVCTSAGVDEKCVSYIGGCKHDGRVSEEWLALSTAGLLVFLVGVLRSERRSAFDDDEGRCSWLRPRCGERLKKSESLRMAHKEMDEE